ncbi:MAG: hypothetical protein J6S80_01275 [Alphaproteobacteria bacterium]|nr:hypothetical protein [Alphaproteobacteria bacterium]
MATKNTIIEFDTGVDIKTAIQFVIDLVRNAQRNYDLVYNDWFKMTVTPATTLQYGLNLFFSGAMLQKNLGMGQIKTK